MRASANGRIKVTQKLVHLDALLASAGRKWPNKSNCQLKGSANDQI
jgi:hypothetical protein